jgi:hypothetical protein
MSELSLQTLATELRATRRAQQTQGATLRRHVKDCGKLQEATAQRLAEGAETMGEMQVSLSGIEDRFKSFDRWTAFLTKYGKWIAGIVVTAIISAWVSVLVQNYYLHQQTAKAAQAAASSASQAASGQTVVLHKLNEIAPGP